MKINKIFALAAMALPMTASAQGTAEVLPNIQFESEDYAKLSVYDTWEESPFRVNKFANPAATQPLLQGNVKVTGNFLQELDEQLNRVVNPSEKILAVQRSIYGSNTFGARIDLKQPFELTPTVKYLHVMVNRPYSGRVMVVGLGKRRNNAEQSKETEQFWAMSLGDVPADKWYDVVLPIKGNGGIDIYSLVVVPDCESPHTGTASKMCYIDNVCVNHNPRPAFVYEYYPVSFDKNAEITRNDRYLSGVGLQSNDGKQQVMAKGAKKLAYHNFAEESLKAALGETITPLFNYAARGPMFGYVYVDWNQNGRFEDNELMSSARSGANNAITVPAFTVPQGTVAGNYYMRYKVDWDNTDPAGSVAPGNELVKNGGGIMDVRLNIHGSTCNVNTKGLNGDLFAVDEQGKLVALNNYKVPFGKDFKVRIVPENGFTYEGITVKHGYKLSGQEVEKDCRQWKVDTYKYVDFDENNELVIPASCMDGEEIEIENFFIESKGEPFSINPTPQTTNLKSTYYLIKGTSDKGTGYVYCDGNKLVIDHQVSFSEKVTAEQYKYLWSVSNDGKGNYQLENYQDLCYFGNGNFQSQEFGVTAPATFTLNEVSPKFAPGKWCTMQTNQNGHVTYIHMNGAQNQAKLGYWDSGNVGNEAGSIALFQFSEIQAVPRIRVTYNYVLDGEVFKQVKKIQGPQSNYKAPVMNVAHATVNYADDKKVSAENCNIMVNIIEHLPFVKTTDKNAPNYQAIDMRGSDKVLYWNLADNGDVKASEPQGGRTNVELLTSDAYLWCIMGNVIDGFKIYNKKKGLNFALKNTDPASLAPEEEASSWFFSEGHSSIAGSVSFYVNEGSYLNWQDDRLKYWSEKDAGSSVRFFSPYDMVEEGLSDHVTMPGLVGGRTYFDTAANAEAFSAAYRATKAHPYDATAANTYARQLRAAKATSFKTNDNVKVGKYYRIKNYKRMISSKGSWDNYDRAFQGGYLGTTPYPKNTKQLTCGTETLDDAGTIWEIVAGSNGNFKLRNMNTGKFAGKQDNREGSKWVTMQEETGAGEYHIERAADAQYKIICGNDVFHLSAPGVMYYNAADDASKWLISEATELEVKLAAIGNASYASLYVPFAVALPAGTEAYTGLLDEAAAVLTMQKTTEKVPANTGIILKNTDKQRRVNLAVVNEILPSLTHNSLLGTNTSVPLDDSNRPSYWVLGNHPTEGLGFYHFTGNTLGRNKAYIYNATAAANGFRLDFGDVTGVEKVETTASDCSATYDLAGRRVDKMGKGVYIVRGKKVYVK